MTGPSDQETIERLREVVGDLAELERPPCSPGEREAAERIAGRLRELGARVRLEEERVHATYYWPLGLATAAAAVGGLLSLRGHRVLGGALGALAGAAIAEDLAGVPRRRLRERLPQEATTNVVAEVGDPDAARTLVVHAHHDAARTSFIFDQTLPRLIVKTFPDYAERMDRWPPLMGLVVAGPALVGVGSLTGRTGLLKFAATGSAVAAGVMWHMSRQAVVPGANDNLTGVAVLVELARALRERPVDGLRVILLSTGSEEGNQAGMLAFAARHFDTLDPATTSFFCLDTLGSQELVLIEGEGFLQMLEYPRGGVDRVQAAATETGVHVRRGLRFTFATDGLVPLRRGYEVATVGSCNEYLVPANYHMPTDTAANVEYESVLDALRLTEAVVRRAADEAS